jgi:hypothetical protein
MIPVIGKRRREQIVFNLKAFKIVTDTARVEKNSILQFPRPHKVSHTPIHKLKVK